MPFLVVALILSLFHGVMAPDIFVADKDGSARPWAWYVHQFWLNFCGSVAGWTALWFLAQKVASSLTDPAAVAPQISDAALFLLAFVGVTGYLPFAVVTSIQAIKELLAKIPGFGK